VIPAWVVPTARTIPWAPMAGVAACLVAMSAVAAVSGAWPARLSGVAAAGLAAALVAGLRDPAAALVAAVATSPARRRARREALLVTAGLALWLGALASARLWDAGVGWPLGPLAALTSTGLAVAVWAPERIAVEAGVAAPLLWFAVSAATGELDADLLEGLVGWQHHPWTVTAAASTALLMRRNR
jgi:hypothetical protein